MTRSNMNTASPGAAPAPNALHSSQSNEHYTPVEIVDLAFCALGGIDLDPASCSTANRIVGARHYFTKEQNGLTREWHGRVFLNPPGGRCDADGRAIVAGCTSTGACGLPSPHTHPHPTSSMVAWWLKLMREYQAGRAVSAFFVGFSLEILQSAQGRGYPTPLDFPFCIPRKRVRFLAPDGDEFTSGTSPTHGNVLVFIPPRSGAPADIEVFLNLARDLGEARLPRSVLHTEHLSRSAQIVKNKAMDCPRRTEFSSEGALRPWGDL